MTKRIFQSICLAAIGVFLASVALFLWVLYDYFGNVQMGQLRTETELAAHGVEYAGAAFFPGLGAKDYRITWIGTDGQVLYDSQTNSGEMENHLEREEIREALETGSGESARYSATLMERTLYCAKRLTDGTVIRLSVFQNTILTLLLGMSQPLVIIAVIAVILSALLAYRLARHITAPLNRLDLDEPLKNGEYDELSPLLHRLDAQQRQIRRQQEELAERFESVTEKERAAQMLREFTANVTHELKTPLHTIAGCAELLENGMVKDEDKGRFYTQIHSEAQRMIRLVADIIHLSHLDEGAADMRREDVDLYALAAEAVKSLAGAAEVAGIAVTLEGGPAVLNGVPQLLESIVHNLCDNAIKYNRRGGTVTIRVEDSGEAARLTVADTGIGIPSEAQERIFERFYRVDKSRSKELGGTGLGLSSSTPHGSTARRSNCGARRTWGRRLPSHFRRTEGSKTPSFEVHVLCRADSGRFLCDFVIGFIGRQMYACPVNRSRLETFIMKHECRITVLEKKCFPELQEKYLAYPRSGPCPFFQVGDTFVLKRTPQRDDFYHLMNGKFCGEAWDAVSRYIYTALQGGSIMKGWTNDDRMMIACCNDGTRPVIFKIERIDIPESDEERAWLEKQDFSNSAEDAYTG